MSRIVIVSNLLPLKVKKIDKEGIILDDRIGGFSSVLRQFHRDQKRVQSGLEPPHTVLKNYQKNKEAG